MGVNEVVPLLNIVLCLFCDDAVALYHQFTARGIDAAEPFVGNALWVTSVADPDGYRLDFESPTDLPEETKLSELDPAKWTIFVMHYRWIRVACTGYRRCTNTGHQEDHGRFRIG